MFGFDSAEAEGICDVSKIIFLLLEICDSISVIQQYIGEIIESPVNNGQTCTM